MGGGADIFKSKEELLSEIQQLRERLAAYEAPTTTSLPDPTQAARDAVHSLGKSDERFHACLDNMLDCFALLSSIRDPSSGQIVDFRFDYVNPAGCRQNALTPEEQVGKRLLELLPWQREMGLFDLYCRVVETGRAHEMEFTRMAGSFSEVRIWKMDDGVAISWRDISPRKRAEEQLQRISQQLAYHVENTPLAVIEWGPDQRVSRWSAAAQRVFGWEASEVVGKSIGEFAAVHEEDRDEVERIARGLLTGEAPRSVNCNRNYRKDGSVIYCQWHNSALMDESGQLRSILSLVQDVTEQRAAQAELERAKQAAEQANVAKDHFLAALSHELRTPLTPALVSLSALLDDPRVPQALHEELHTILRNVQLEVYLIDDLLDLNRIAHSRLSLEPHPVSIDRLLRRAIAICQADIRSKNLHLAVDIQQAVHPWIHGDPARLQQVLWNLIKNAVKFTPDGGSISIRASNQAMSWTENAPPHLQIEITDTGIGIEAELLPKVFTAFEQGGADFNRRFGGLGLGLAISKKLVELHGGTLTASSDGKGKGATFTLVLPTIPTPAPQANASSAEGLNAPATAKEKPLPLRILLVEDHPDTARVMQQLLARYGHNVIIAHTLASAIDISRLNEFDLIISDIGLPDGSGIDLLNRLQNAPPAVALSGYGMDSDIAAAKAAGFVEHLTKPVNLEHLQAILSRVARVSTDT